MSAPGQERKSRPPLPRVRSTPESRRRDHHLERRLRANNGLTLLSTAPDSDPGPRIRRLRSSTRRLERVLDHVGRDLSAHALAGADRESIMHAAPHADILLLLGHISQAGELPRLLG